MKLIFLDIDGVLNSVEYSIGMRTSTNRYVLHSADPVKIGLLRFLCEMTKADIVITSTWRLGKEASWFEGYFEREGWPNPPILDITPIGSDNKIGRGDEVGAWLEHHSDGTPIHYVIFDDDSDFYDYQPLIHCDATYGLTLKEVIKAIDILGLRDVDDIKTIEDLRQYVDKDPKV